VSGEVSIGFVVVGGIAVAGVVGMAAGSALTYAVGGALGAVGRHLEAKHAEWVRERAAAEDWEALVREVVVRNARIGLLGTELQRAGIAAAAPAGLVLSGQSPDEVAEWCADVDVALAALESRVIAASVAAARRIGVAEEEAVSAASVLGALPDLPDPRSPSVDPATIDRVLGRLLPGAAGVEWDALVAAVAHTRAATGVIDGRNRLGDLRRRVDQLNARTERHRADAAEAAGLLQPLRAVAGEEAAGLRTALAEVVSGHRPLDGALRAAATEQCRTIQADADRRYVHDEILAGLRELGYDPDDGLGTAVPDGVALTFHRDGWSRHAVRLVIDSDSDEMRSMVVRTEAGGSDQKPADAEREGEWCSAVDALTDRLQKDGVRTRVVSRTEPGGRAVPTVTAARRRRHRAEDERERAR
jgi:hypothetical protein